MIVTVCIPAKNEEGIIENVIDEVKPFADEILVIDGHSTDGTAEAARRHGARVVLDNGTGKGDAIKVGLHEAAGNIIVFIDADGSHEPKDIPNLIGPIVDGTAEIVIASRLSGGSDESSLTIDGLLRHVGGVFITLTINFIWHVRLSDVLNGFRAVKLDAARSLTLKTNYFDIEQEMVIKALKKGYRIVEVPSHEYERKRGHTKNSTWRGWRFIVGLLKEIFIT